MSTTMIEPRHRVVPARDGSFADEILAFAREHGADLDDWQADVVDAFSGTLDGELVSTTNVLTVARQNGKSEIGMWRALYGLFVLRKRLILFSSHQWASSNEIFLRMRAIIEENEDLAAQVKYTRLAPAQLGFELETGERILFLTRSRAAARGFSANEIYFDECHFLSEAAHASLKPSAAGKSAQEAVQFFYFASAPDQTRHPDCFVLTRLRQHALEGTEGIAYVEFNAGIVDEDDRELLPAAIPPALLVDRDHVQKANPGAPKRISIEFLLDAARTMDSVSYAVEHLNMGDWPDLDESAQSVVDLDRWIGLRDPDSTPIHPVCVGADISPDRRSAAIAIAGRRPDGDIHLELTDATDGVGWVVPRLRKLIQDHFPHSVTVESAQQLIADEVTRYEGSVVNILDRPEVSRACAYFVDVVEQGILRHLGDPKLLDALKGAAISHMGDTGWVFSRRHSRVDLSVLYAAIFAVYTAGQEDLGRIQIF